MITADTYTSVLPLTQRRCADATAKLVLAAARRTRDKIRKNGRRNRPTPRPATGVPVPTGPATGKKPQSTPPRIKEASRTVMTPEWHPGDTHRPRWAETKRRLARLPAGRTPVDLARPKGLEPSDPWGIASQRGAPDVQIMSVGRPIVIEDAL